VVFVAESETACSDGILNSCASIVGILYTYSWYWPGALSITRTGIAKVKTAKILDFLTSLKM